MFCVATISQIAPTWENRSTSAPLSRSLSELAYRRCQSSIFAPLECDFGTEASWGLLVRIPLISLHAAFATRKWPREIWNTNLEDEVYWEEPTNIRRKDTRHPKAICIRQIVAMLRALRLLSAAVGVDCQEAKACRDSLYPKQTLKKGQLFHSSITFSINY